MCLWVRVLVQARVLGLVFTFASIVTSFNPAWAVFNGTCSALNGQTFAGTDTITVTDSQIGNSFTVSVPAGTTATVSPPGTVVVGPSTFVVNVTSSGPFSFAIVFNAGVGPVTVISNCASSGSSNTSSSQLNALTQRGASTSVANFAGMVEDQVRDRLGGGLDVANGLRHEALMIIADIRALMRREGKRLADHGIFGRPPEPDPDVDRQVGELLRRLDNVNRQLEAGGQRPVVFDPFSSTQFAAETPPQTSNSPWQDSAVAGALGYADTGSGKLPSHMLRSTPGPAWTVWMSGVYTGFARGGATATDGHIGNIMGGADYRLSDKLLIGGALGYEDQRFDTTFNGGYLRGKGATLGPYLAYSLSPNLIANVFAGLAFLDYGVASATTTGSYDATRLFVSASLIGTWQYDRWRFSPRASLFHASERRDSFTDSASAVFPGATVNIGRFSIGPEIGYRFAPAQGNGLLEPFGFAALDCDLGNRNSLVAANGIVVTDGACGGRIGSGLKVIQPGFSVSIGASYNSLFRPDQDSWTLQGRVGRQF
jgi:hypothetical protein